MEEQHVPPSPAFKGQKSNNHQWHDSGYPTQKSREWLRAAEQAPSNPCAHRAGMYVRVPLIFLSPCKWRHGTPNPGGSWWVARAGVPRPAKGIFKPSPPLNLPWQSALVAQPRHLCWPGQHCPHLGHHWDHVCSLRISMLSITAAHKATECLSSSHTYRQTKLPELAQQASPGCKSAADRTSPEQMGQHSRAASRASGTLHELFSEGLCLQMNSASRDSRNSHHAVQGSSPAPLPPLAVSEGGYQGQEDPTPATTSVEVFTDAALLP